MTKPETALRELAEKTFPLFGSRLDEWRKVEQDKLISDLTALIEEHYVSKEGHEAEKKRLLHCGSCGKPLSRDCPRCKHLWET